MQDLYVLGITGPTGSGKTSLRPLLAERCCEFIDCDLLARRVVEPGEPALDDLVDAFGREILNPDGTLNRPRLATIAFASDADNERLCSIVHPRVADLAMSLIDDAHSQGLHAAIDAPLLFQAGFDRLCTLSIAVLADKELRTARIMERDGITREAALQRINAQPDDLYYFKRADRVLFNSGTELQFVRQACLLLDPLLGKPRKRPR